MGKRSNIYKVRGDESLFNENMSLFIELQFITRQKIRVLDVGCANGDFGVLLRKKKPKAEIYGLDCDEGSIEDARQTGAYREVRQVDLDKLKADDLPEYAQSFDYVICGDVLEHLRNPIQVLGILKTYLKPRGFIVASIPNVAHMSIKANLLVNDFGYTPTGLLDETHVHLFTHKSIAQGLAEVSLRVIECGWTMQDRQGMQLNVPWNDIGVEAKEEIFRDWHSYVCQYVMKIEPSSQPDVALAFLNELALRISDDNAPDYIRDYRRQMLASLPKKQGEDVAEEIRGLLAKFENVSGEFGGLAKVSDERRNLEKAYVKLEGDYSHLAEAFKSEQAGAEASRKAYRKLEGDYSHLAETLKSEQAGAEASRKAYSKLEADYNGLSAQLAAAREGAQQSDAAYRKLEGDYSHLAEAFKSEQAGAEASRKAYSKLEADYKGLSAQLSAAREGAQQSDAAYRKLEGDYSRLAKALESAMDDIAERDGVYRQLEGDYQKLEQRFREKQIEVSRLESELAEARGNLSQMEKSLADKDAQLRQKTAEVSERSAQVSYLNKACDEWACAKQQMEIARDDALRQLHELRQSPSWRLTAPLRRIKHGARGVVSKIRMLRDRVRNEMNQRKFLAKLSGCALIFDHNLGGGANEYRKKLMATLASEGIPSVCIHNNLWFYEPRDFSAICYFPGGLKEERRFANWTDCEAFLSKIAFSRIIYNNLVYNNEAERILKWIAAAKCHLTVLVHDFHCLCQFFDMIMPEGKYCGGKESCDECISRRLDLRPVFNKPLPCETWHSLWKDVFARAAEVRVFSPFATNLLEEHFPGISKVVKCVPHDMNGLQLRKAELAAGGGVSLGVVGSIYGKSKGSGILEELADAIAPERIVVIGTCPGVAQKDNLLITGPYKRKDLPSILEKHGINVVFFPSICPETFSYTVSELMMMDVPVIAFDVGAQGYKVRGYDKGMLIPAVTAADVIKTAKALYRKTYGNAKK